LQREKGASPWIKGHALRLTAFESAPAKFWFFSNRKNGPPEAIYRRAVAALKFPLENTITVARACQSGNAYFPLFAGAIYRR
jgi:hypothetical protein